jgi:two-component system, cell cycle response regulator CpdR
VWASAPGVEQTPVQPSAFSSVSHFRNGIECAYDRCEMETQQDTLLSKRILLVDDERSVRETVRNLLAYDEHEVVEANNGAEALRIFTQERFDLVLTDLRMPFLEGDELAVKIRELAPRQPILMITGHAQKPSRMNPVDAILYKPFALDDLRHVMATLLQKSDHNLDTELCPKG